SIRIIWKRPRSPGWRASASWACRATCRLSPVHVVDVCWVRFTWLPGTERVGRLAELRGARLRCQLRGPGERERLQRFLEGRLFVQIPLPVQDQATWIDHGFAGDL